MKIAMNKFEDKTLFVNSIKYLYLQAKNGAKISK